MSESPPWDAVYERLGEAGVSWFQPVPEVSLELIEAAGGARGRAVIDVGGGMSRLANELARRGARRVTVLDVSALALERSRRRPGGGEGAGRIDRVHADVRSWSPDEAYDIWHDRAAFHFLVDPGDRERYARTMRAALASGGHAIVATFAPDGPERCSGRPVARYDPGDLPAALGGGLELVGSRREVHTTPGGAPQAFAWALLRVTEG
jgi:SAM-dependent methyltransferase